MIIILHQKFSPPSFRLSCCECIAGEFELGNELKPQHENVVAFSVCRNLKLFYSQEGAERITNHPQLNSQLTILSMLFGDAAKEVYSRVIQQLLYQKYSIFCIDGWFSLFRSAFRISTHYERAKALLGVRRKSCLAPAQGIEKYVHSGQTSTSTFTTRD